jgi:hypothetical protein
VVFAHPPSAPDLRVIEDKPVSRAEAILSSALDCRAVKDGDLVRAGGYFCTSTFTGRILYTVDSIPTGVLEIACRSMDSAFDLV